MKSKSIIKCHTISCTVFLLLFFSFHFFGQASQKRAFSLDDLYRLKSISNLDLSPDGKQLLFSVTSYNFKKGKTFSNIYRLNLSGGDAQQLTYNKSYDSSPSWSQDGKQIYFLSSREKGSQLWQMEAGGGEAFRVTGFYSGVSALQESVSSGKLQFYFTSTVFPECMENEECNEKRSDKLADGPVQAHIADSLLYRHWNAYRDFQYTHIFSFNTRDKKVTAVTGGTFDYPAWSLGGGDGYDISPDGKTMCVVANYSKKPELSINSDLYLIDLTAKKFEPKNITAKNKSYDGHPVFSPNGKTIAYTNFNIIGYEADKRSLSIYDLKTGQSKCLTDSLDNPAGNFQWSHDSKYLYFTLEEKGYSPLLRVKIANGKIERILEGHSIRQYVLNPNGNGMIFTRTSVGEPVEIWKYRFAKKGKGKQLKQLTHLNQKVADEVDIRPAESHWVEGANGKKVHVFLVKPHGFDASKKYPLIMNIHGGPQMQWSDSFRGDWQVYPGSGYIVAFPNPHGSTGYGKEFTEAISKDWDGKVIEDVYKVSDYLAGLDYVDSKRMGAMGWSWGGYAIMWLEGHNKHFKAMASMMGIYDNRTFYSGTEELWFPEWDLGGKPWDNPKRYLESSPSAYVKNFNTPCLIITGERDYRVPYNMSVEFFTDLQMMNVPSRLIVFKNDGHWPSNARSMPVYYNAHLEWFHKYLKGGKAPYDTEKMIRNMAYEKKKCQDKKSGCCK